MLAEASRALSELLSSLAVDDRVKKLLREEYPAGSALFKVFVVHSYAVAKASERLARVHGAEQPFVTEAAWLHDIGIKYTRAPGIHCLGNESYLRHGIIGRALCDHVGLPEHGLVCETHVGTGLTALEIEKQRLPLPKRDMLPQTLEERIVCYADQFFSKSQLDTVQALPLEQVSRRIKHHGQGSWERFCTLQEEFGDLPG